MEAATDGPELRRSPRPSPVPATETSTVTMKALAHPLRLRVLRHLSTNGPATSTTLAAALGENTGTLSYHLRRLEGGGLIEDAPDHPSGRERWWRAVRGLDIRRAPGAGASTEERTAAAELDVLRAADDRALLDRFHAEEATGEGWLRGSRSMSHLTRDELNAFHDAYLELLGRFSRGPEDATPDTCPVLLRWFALPSDAPDGTDRTEAPTGGAVPTTGVPNVPGASEGTTGVQEAGVRDAGVPDADGRGAGVPDTDLPDTDLPDATAH
ncbi:ArsR/SmtB family transcription factor [Streptomyces sp. NBC_01497]|uniref:ArsR/SmtB family transcription factor n=1 Tax=Streptomyces sp. NBC_01497 TaxID=2903885 RepID=UPI002E33A059|nr:helix-turn-helix domain-containing protein [Streptomyces sp. NBC_01497]